MGTIAQQLQALVARELGLSASGVAEKLGLSRQAWHYARTSTTSPHVSTVEGWLARLAKAGLVARVVVTADGPTVEHADPDERPHDVLGPPDGSPDAD